MWQGLRSELHPQGLEIVTIALDVDAEAARQWIEQTKPNHPSLIDSAHRVDELFGICQALGLPAYPSQPPRPGGAVASAMSA